MFGQTIYIGNPSYLHIQDRQLVIKQPARDEAAIRPIEDIGFIVLDHPQIQLTQAVVQACLESNVALIYCDQQHMPAGMVLPYDGHYLHQGRIRTQLETSVPFKNRLWQAIIQSKIRNQANLLRLYGLRDIGLETLISRVTSGDKTNIEAQASRQYWSILFTMYVDNFTRNRDGIPPNNLLNYGYAILRGVVSRAISGAGLLPVLGIHHENKYNAFGLADDLMEPFRPFVDALTISYLEMTGEVPTDLTREHKSHMLQLMQMDVQQPDGSVSPLQHAVESAVYSFVSSLESKKCQIAYGRLPARA